MISKEMQRVRPRSLPGRLWSEETAGALANDASRKTSRLAIAGHSPAGRAGRASIAMPGALSRGPAGGGRRPALRAAHVDLDGDDGVDDYVEFSAGGLWPTALQTTSDSAPGEFSNPDPCHEWVWSLGEILTALLDAGLQITRFEEYPYTNGWRPLPDMLEQPGRRWVPPMPGAWMPLMYGLRATRPA